MSLVSLVEVRESSGLRDAILDSLDLIHYKFPSDARNALIKPNMCYYWDYSTGQTTDPRFVGALIEIMRSQISPDINISIVESDASAMKCEHAFKVLGYEKLARDYGVSLVNLSADKGENLKIGVGKRIFNITLPKTIRNADIRVNVPKIKYLVQTGISCGLKNIFGCYPYPQKYRYHGNLNEAIVAINKLIKFDLCIMDGIVVAGVHPRRLGLVMTSRDAVALDAAAAKIAGMNPRSIHHIRLAHRDGLGSISFSAVGADLHCFEALFPRKGPVHTLLNFGYSSFVNLGLAELFGISEMM